MRKIGGFWVLVCLGVFQVPLSAQPATDPAASVFELITMSYDGRQYRGVGLGTAFFVNIEGTALTNSHVVYRAKQDPAHYQLLALVGKEFYSVMILCASHLDRDPAKNSAARPGLDVAVVKLAPSQFSFTRLTHTDQTGDVAVIATAHLGALPHFPALDLRDDPAPGEPIHVIGFGKETAFTLWPSQWTTAGTVRGVGTASDGTRILAIAFVTRPAQGGSGSPILDSEDRVVGILTWILRSSSALDGAIGASSIMKYMPPGCAK